MNRPLTFLLCLAGWLLVVHACGKSATNTTPGGRIVVGGDGQYLKLDYNGDGQEDVVLDCYDPEFSEACLVIRNGGTLPDSDGDGLEDIIERLIGTNPLSVDYDGDGLSDGRELQFGTNPLVADSDGDTYSDGAEVNAGTNPNDEFDYPGSSGGTPTSTPTPNPDPCWYSAIPC